MEYKNSLAVITVEEPSREPSFLGRGGGGGGAEVEAEAMKIETELYDTI